MRRVGRCCSRAAPTSEGLAGLDLGLQRGEALRLAPAEPVGDAELRGDLKGDAAVEVAVTDLFECVLDRRVVSRVHEHAIGAGIDGPRAETLGGLAIAELIDRAQMRNTSATRYRMVQA